LRTPLNAVIGYSALMKQGVAGPLTEKQHKYANNIELSGQHLLDMVNDILDVSKIEAGKIQLALQPVALQRLLQELDDVLSGLTEQKQVDLRLDSDPALETLTADPARLRQIFFNLISNAIKFNKPGGNVQVRLSKESEWLLAEVQDTGIGVPQSKQAELFTEFYQVDASPSRVHQGTGLGLVLTRRLIELHGGHIWVESDEGLGSTFRFKLPISGKPSEVAQSLSESGRGSDDE